MKREAMAMGGMFAFALLFALLYAGSFLISGYSIGQSVLALMLLFLIYFALATLAYGSMVDRHDKRTPNDFEHVSKRLAWIALVFVGAGLASITIAAMPHTGQHESAAGTSRWFCLRSETGEIYYIDLLLVSAMLGVIMVWGPYIAWLNRKDKPYHRGRKILTIKDARKAARREKKSGEKTFPLGGVEIPESAAWGHTLFVGTTGSGKTISILPYMQRAIEEITPGSNQRALIYDAKQDTISKLHGMNLKCPIRILNPFDLRSVAWDMAKDCTSLAICIQFASIFVPTTNKNDSTHFFDQSVKDLLANVFIALHRKTPGKWTFRDVLQIMMNINRLQSFLRENLPNGGESLMTYFAETKTRDNIMSSIRARLARFEPIAATWAHADEQFSITEWAQSESILVLGNDESCRQPIDTVNAVLFNRIVEEVLAQPDSQDRRSWFFLDEIADAGPLEKLSTLLIKGRSKGVTVVMGFQDIEGMHHAYGKNKANELIGQCSNIGVMRLSGTETPKYAADLFGDYEIEEESTSQTRSKSGNSSTTSKNKKTYRSVLPSEWQSLFQMSERQGLGGFYISPAIGAWSAVLTKEQVLRELKPACPETPDFVPRSVEQQLLPEWTDADNKKFGITVKPTEKQANNQSPPNKSTPPSKKKRGGRMIHQR